MRYYPAFLDLHGKRCVVVGAGGVGRRKLQTLLKCGPASVLLVDAAPADDALRALMASGPVTHACRAFADSDLDGAFLVIAATGDAAANARVAALCRDNNILCNVVDAPEAGTFIVPAHIEQDEVVVALSTSGHSPALARRIKRDLQDMLGSRYTGLVAVMARLRPLVLGLGDPTESNTAVFRAVVESDLADTLAGGDGEAARMILRRIVPPRLHDSIEEVLHGLV
ncbi:MAG: bifunctional precorrin-2 dehydrogenase/sirohydrochlorin ferrochelatase [Desulfovibrionaceae bacterium]